MKLTLLQENFSKAVSLASRFSSSRSQLPILGNILLTASKAKLKISSTNLEVSVSTQIGAKIEEEGELSIPSKVLSEIIGNLPKDSIELETDKEQLKIKTPGFTSKVLGMNASDFPKIPDEIKKDAAIQLPQKEISESFPKILFAASTDETRPVLTGVLFILDKDLLTLVATDGFRLSRKKIHLKNEKAGRVIVPKSVLGEVQKLIQESSEVVFSVEDKDKQVLFGTGDTILTSRVIEGDFPDFEKIIPQSFSISVLTDKEDFLRAVKLASIFARESANIVKLRLGKDFIGVFAESSASGSQETKVDAKVEGDLGQGFEIAFNYRFLEEFLHSSGGEDVGIEFTTSDKAGVFKDLSDTDHLHLIMPVRLQG